MWEAIAYVTSGITLVAFIAAAAAWVYRYKLLQQERLISTAPESERARLVARALEVFEINTEKLTREQQFELARQQILARAARSRDAVIVVIVIAVLAAAVALFAIYRGQTSEKPSGALQRQPDDIDISEVGFVDYEGDSRAPRLDIKLTNIGSRSAFVKRVKLNVKKSWRLVNLPQVTGVVVPPEHNYVVTIKPSDEYYQVILPVSHGLKPDDFGRFTIQIQEEPWPSSNTIYLVDVEIIANGNDAVFRSKDLLFIVTQYGTGFPDSKALQEIVRAEKSLGREVDIEKLKKDIATNKALILNLSKIKATRSPGLESLIETTKNSDLG